jgi:uncharacterized membrane protein YgaE (UPF0421/DUF939 family)
MSPSNKIQLALVSMYFARISPMSPRVVNSMLSSIASVITCAILLSLDSLLNKNLIVIGLIWSVLVANLDIRFAISYSTTSIIGVSAGIGLGLLVNILEISNPRISSLVCFIPCIFLWYIHADLGIMALYLIAVFKVKNPSSALFNSQSMFLVVLVGCLSGIVLSFIGFYVYNPRKRAIKEYADALLHNFEGFTAYMRTGGDDHHQEELRKRQKLVREKSLGITSDSSSISGILACSASLALIPCSGEYSDQLWNPIQHKIYRLSSLVSKCLYNIQENLEIPGLCDDIYKDLISSISSVDFYSDEVYEFVYQIISLLRYSRIINRFVKDVQTPSSQLSSIAHLIWKSLRNSWIGEYSTYPLKGAVILQIGVQLLLFWDDENMMFIFWGVIPLIYCVLPNIGGSCIKGIRRILGTVFGTLLGFLSIFASTNIMIETGIVMYISRWLSINTKIGYAAIIFGLTWILVISSNGRVDDMYKFILYRVVMNILGSAIAIILSCLIFPELGIRKYQASVKGILDVSISLLEKSVDVIFSEHTTINEEEQRGEEGDGERIKGPELVHEFIIEAGKEAHNKLRIFELARISLKEESMVEYWIISWLGFKKCLKGIGRVMEIEKELKELEQASLVLFVTASGTLSSVEVKECFIQMRSQLNGYVDEVKKYASKMLIKGKEATFDGDKFESPFIRVKEKYRFFRNATKNLMKGGLLRLDTFIFTLERFDFACQQLFNKIL